MNPIKSISTLAIRTSKGVQSIKVLYDGTFDRMGKNLLTNYSKSYKVILGMMKKGYLVRLGETLKKYDAKDEPNGTLDLTQMNKERVNMDIYPTLADLVQKETDSEYIYLWDKDRWYAMKVINKMPYNNLFTELEKLI